MRTETDFLGKVNLDDNTLYGIATARAMYNFAGCGRPADLSLIYAMVNVKKAAAMAYLKLQLADEQKSQAIIAACDRILKGEADEAFVTPALQGGAGTSTNMNVNEVIANLGLLELGKQCGEYEFIDPLDDVNRGQSTNDVYPTALRIAAIWKIRTLSDECALLQEALQKKETEFGGILKLGRTELMDAVPITLGQEFGAFAQAVARDRWRIYKVEERLRQMNLGGTAVGTGSNAARKYTYLVTDIIRELTDIGLARAEYPMDLTQNNDVFVEVSGLLKALAVNLMKISNDLRLMNSGPFGGFAEIILEPLQAGSTIMPGKVNPVIPEMVTQVAIKVMANDTAIAMSAASGNFELNAFLPLIADSLLESLSLLITAVQLFRTKCVATVKANAENCKKHLEHSAAKITALVPYIGYKTAGEIYLKCKENPTDENIKAEVLARGLLDEETLNRILDYKNELGNLISAE